MEPQLFVGREEPSPDLFQPVSNSDDCLGAKPRGGLWTSTYNPSYGSDWIRWCQAEDFHVPRAGWKAWLLTPRPGAELLHVYGTATLAGILDLYGRAPRYEMIEGQRVPDFEKLARDEFDGLHLSRLGEQRTRHSMPNNLCGWDCESTIWLHWAFSEVKYLGIHHWQERPMREIAHLIAD